MKERTSRRSIGITIMLLATMWLGLTIFDSIKTKRLTVTTELPLEPAFEDNNVAIVFAPDTNCLGFLSVVVASITKNISDNHNYDIVILEKKLAGRCKRRLMEQLRPFENVSIRFVNMKEFFDNYDKNDIYNINESIESYSRFFIPDIFHKYEKVIWLDIDTLVYVDLADLYDIDVGNNMIAAVRDITTNNWPSDRQTNFDLCSYLYDKFNYKNCYKYANMGVVLYGIKNCEKENFVDRCLEQINKIDYKVLKSPEQDIMNLVCEDKIKYIGYEYNMFASYLNNIHFMDGAYLHSSIIENPKIVHFEDFKPWRDEKSYNGLYGYKWTEMTFNSKFFLNRKAYIFLLKTKIAKYNLYKKFTRSEDKIKFYNNIILNLNKRIKYFNNNILYPNKYDK